MSSRWSPEHLLLGDKPREGSGGVRVLVEGRNAIYNAANQNTAEWSRVHRGAKTTEKYFAFNGSRTDNVCMSENLLPVLPGFKNKHKETPLCVFRRSNRKESSDFPTQPARDGGSGIPSSVM